MEKLFENHPPLPFIMPLRMPFSEVSHRNLQYIRQCYLFYNENIEFVQQPVAQISEDVFFSVP
ncbi:MAG: hypothetical protein LUC88_03035 [Prevotella sp.]|nr:hypothetical protein [Prevotella sp.]